jgi:methyltransferase (TIGR00027 family)
VTARWLAAQRLRLEPTRPSTPTGDLRAEHDLYRDVAGGLAVPPGPSPPVARRTQVIDAEVAGALGRGIAQIVLLGAGYDGRPLRFGGGAARWFEVDRPGTLADKRRRLSAQAGAAAAGGAAEAGVTSLGLDLLTDDAGSALAAAGHDATAPTLFVCEDLFGSLTLAAAAALCASLRARAAPGSELVAGFPVVPAAAAPVRALRAATGLLRRATAEPRRHEFRPGDPEKLVVVTGWRVTHAETSSGRRLDRGAHGLLLVCEPDGAGGAPGDPAA